MDFKALVVNWNNQFPLDYWYRKKHNIRFNSTQHRSTNLVDILFEFVEERLFEQAREQYRTQQDKQARYEKEGWIQERTTIFEHIEFSESDLSLFDEHD